MMIFNPSMVAGGALTLASCLLYREIQRAVLSNVSKVTKVAPTLVSARLAVAGLICESKREDLADDIDVCYIDVEDRARLIVDAEFDEVEIPSLPVRPNPKYDQAEIEELYRELRPIVYQEDGKPLMYVGGLDALKGSAHGAWMDRKGDN